MFMLIAMFLTSLMISLIMIFMGFSISKKKFFDRELQSPFECGFSTLIESRAPFSLRFFLLALIFMIFDVELIILFPYLLQTFSFFNMFIMLFYILFLLILTLGLIHEWNMHMLEWHQW